MTLDAIELIRSMANRTRLWRGRAITTLLEKGCTDLGYRPASGMASIGWILAHQAAVYDYSLNVLIKGGSAKSPEIFRKHTPGTDGAWTGLPLPDTEDYYSSGEEDLLAYIEDATDAELISIPQHQENMPATFRGLRVIDLIANTFVHLGHHNGHLNAIAEDWARKNKK